MLKLKYSLGLVVVLILAFLIYKGGKRLGAPDTPEPKLWKEIDLSALPGEGGFYPSFGDLDNDGSMDVLLHRVGGEGEASYLIALDQSGRKLWELGDTAHRKHTYYKHEPPNRAIAIVYDLDHNGKNEVVAEIPDTSGCRIVILDGSTGQELYGIPSPFDTLRPQLVTRSHPMAFIAYMHGPDTLPTLMVKFEGSNHVRGIAVGYNHKLQEEWVFQKDRHSVGHIPQIADIDLDGREEIGLGYAILDDTGELLWEADIPEMLHDHADMVTAADVLPEPGLEILIAECHRDGNAYCYSSSGELLWRNAKDCDHTECIWAGNFIPEMPGTELMIQNRGHRAIFISADAETGKRIRRIRYNKDYTDWPMKISWVSDTVQSLWMPLNRSLIDGNGVVIQDLGEYDAAVKSLLGAGTTKEQLGVQAFGLDICGDSREELVLYQPFHGQRIFIFTQSDGTGALKTFLPQQQAYNMRTIH